MTLFLEDPALLAAFRRGDRAALERVYREYVRRVEAVVLRGLRKLHHESWRAADLRDLVQETFTRAFGERARRSYDGIRPFAPFLNTIACNLLANEARRSGREPILERTPELPEPDPPPEKDQPWADPSLVRVVEDYLASLPEELALVHQQRYVHGRSQELAAAALGISRQQLRTRELRLRDGLAEALRRNQERARAVKLSGG